MDQGRNHSPANPFKPYEGRFESYRRIPMKGRQAEDILHELGVIATEEDRRWKTGRISGTYYNGGADHLALLNRAFSLFSHVNVLQFDLCPSMAKFESEIVAMTAGMLGADAARDRDPADEVCGTVTSGGTESIMMAMKVYRDRGCAEKGITQPEVILPVTAHPAFLKAGEYFGIAMRRVPVHPPDFLVDPDEVKAAVSDSTVAIVGSAGSYPYGLVDPIERLGEIAQDRGIGLHVDGCLGGFILPWIERIGYTVPRFDFRVPGVTSLSADTHKFGYALKGTSVVLYRNRALRRYQFFQVPDWPGGIYASPSATGSRSGGLLAAAWASLVSMGEEGFMDAASAIMKVADAIKEGIASIPELAVIGNPTFLISFMSDAVDVFHINDFMSARGWRFNPLQLPPALHFCVTLPQTMVPGIADAFIADLKEGVAYAKDHAGEPAKSKALYGIAGTVEGNQTMRNILLGFFDLLYEVP